MYISFENMPDSSRVWIYQANRKFTIQENEYISAKAIQFVEGWTRHGDDLKGSFTIKYDQFIVMAVDEQFNGVSGCSIDASVRLIKELEQELNIDLTNKLNVTYKQEERVVLVSLSEFQDLAKQGKITSQTIVFNNMIESKNQLATSWEVKASESWHNRFLG